MSSCATQEPLLNQGRVYSAGDSKDPTKTLSRTTNGHNVKTNTKWATQRTKKCCLEVQKYIKALLIKWSMTQYTPVLSYPTRLHKTKSSELYIFFCLARGINGATSGWLISEKEIIIIIIKIQTHQEEFGQWGKRWRHKPGVARWPDKAAAFLYLLFSGQQQQHGCRIQIGPSNTSCSNWRLRCSPPSELICAAQLARWGSWGGGRSGEKILSFLSKSIKWSCLSSSLISFQVFKWTGLRATASFSSFILSSILCSPSEPTRGETIQVKSFGLPKTRAGRRYCNGYWSPWYKMCYSWTERDTQEQWRVDFTPLRHKHKQVSLETEMTQWDRLYK